MNNIQNKKVFISNKSFNDAAFKAKMSGYQIIGQARNKIGQYVVFARPMFRGY
jgi:hypothetical protein